MALRSVEPYLLFPGSMASYRWARAFFFCTVPGRATHSGAAAVGTDQVEAKPELAQSLILTIKTQPRHGSAPRQVATFAGWTMKSGLALAERDPNLSAKTYIATLCANDLIRVELLSAKMTALTRQPRP